MKTMISDLQEKKIPVKEYPSGYSIEIEAEFNVPFDDNFSNKYNMRLTGDGSLRNFGVEFISRSPSSLLNLKKNIKGLLSEPVFDDYINTTRTSTHIHANIQHMTKEELFKTLMIYYAVEPLLFEFCGPTRKSNLFCFGMWEAEANTDVLYDIYKGDYSGVSRNFNNYKYSALNIANVAKLGTIEFRHMRGTKDPEPLWKWLDIIDRVYNSHKLFRDIDHVWESYSRDRYGFLTKVLDGVLEIPYNYLEETDKNYSTLYEITDFENRLKKEIKKNKKSYVFSSEIEIDTNL